MGLVEMRWDDGKIGIDKIRFFGMSVLSVRELCDICIS